MKNNLQTIFIFLVVLYSSAVLSTEYSAPEGVGSLKKSVYEIRNYHYDPAKFDAFSKWFINDAAPFLKANFDVVGIWIGAVDTPVIAGTDPMKLSLGSANATWIIRWESLEERKRIHETVFGSEEWYKIWSNHPDTDGYLQVEVRFANRY